MAMNSSDRAKLAVDACIARKKTKTKRARAKAAARWQSGDLVEAQQPPAIEDEADENAINNAFIDQLKDLYELEISVDDF